MEQVIRRAEFTVYPSIWYENCPFSVMESQIYGTPVVASKIGGIPELVDGTTGVLFKAGDTDELTMTIDELWNAPEKVDAMRKACPAWVDKSYLSVKDYCEKLLKIYRGESVTDND
jgi:glycosyltransferase involved in cell wall biosynthesis